MTRINLMDVSLLTDQHLFAEYREITRVPQAVNKSLVNKSIDSIIKSVPESFRLNQGHVKFFYDKLLFIESRYFALRDELLKRNFNITLKDDVVLYRNTIPEEFYKDFIPNKIDMTISVERIIEKINDKPLLYKLNKQSINSTEYIITIIDHISNY